MSWDYEEGRGFIFDESDCYELEDEYNEYECPECGSHNVKIRQRYEGTDRDGNRGILVEVLTCNNSKCGYDEW